MKVENKKSWIIISSCINWCWFGGAGVFVMLNNSNSEGARKFSKNLVEFE